MKDKYLSFEFYLDAWLYKVKHKIRRPIRQTSFKTWEL